MRQRHLPICILLLALMLSAWGNMLAAAFCPHISPGHACCDAQISHHPASHEVMMSVQMSDMQVEPVAEQKTDARAFSQPFEACEHCTSHSQLPLSPITLRDADQTRRNADVIATVATAEPVSSNISFATNSSARVHAPPGSHAPARHLLISVFRI